MSKILNLKIENCEDCIFSFYELREKGKEGFYCRGAQTPFFLGTNSDDDTKTLSTEIHENCHLSDSLKKKKPSSFKERMAEAKLIQEIDNCRDFISQEEMEIITIDKILEENPYHQDLLKVSNNILDEILERNVTIKTLNSLKILLNRPM